MESNTPLEAMTAELLKKMPAGSGFKSQLDAVTTGFGLKMPVEFQKGETFIAGLVNSDQFKAALKPGDKFPAFELPDAAGVLVQCSDLLAKGPLLLIFYRGEWCPYCNLALKALQDQLPAINAAGVTLVAVSPQLPNYSLSTQQKQGLAYPVLSDTGNVLARQLGIIFTLNAELKIMYEGFGIDLLACNGEESFELPVPGAYLIDRNGVIVERYLDPDYRNRLEPETAVAWARMHGSL
jgi:peroxiredoxin